MYTVFCLKREGDLSLIRLLPGWWWEHLCDSTECLQDLLRSESALRPDISRCVSTCPCLEVRLGYPFCGARPLDPHRSHLHMSLVHTSCSFSSHSLLSSDPVSSKDRAISGLASHPRTLSTLPLRRTQLQAPGTITAGFSLGRLLANSNGKGLGQCVRPREAIL